MTQPMMYAVQSSNTELKIWATTATTSATGALAVTLPTGVFTQVVGIQATCVRDAVNATQASFAMVRSFSTSGINIQVYESKTTGMLLGGVAEGLEVATTATTVLVAVFGN